MTSIHDQGDPLPATRRLLCRSLVISLALSAAAGATPPKSTSDTDSNSSLVEEIERIDRKLRLPLLDRAADPTASLVTQEYLQVLAAKAAHDPELQGKFRVLDLMRREVARRSRRTQAASAAWRRPSERRVSHLGRSRHRTCLEALSTADGTKVAMTLSSDYPEVWLRYRATEDGLSVASTFGSDIDTTVEVYPACPSGNQAPRARFDDEVGLQARATLNAQKGVEQWIRIAGWRGATGYAAVTIEGGSPGIAGRVSRDDTGAALEYWRVVVYDNLGDFVTTAETNSDGSYIIANPAGTYFAAVEPPPWSSGLLAELYDDIPCMGGPPSGCTPAAGTAIEVPAEAVVFGVDFVVGSGGAIAGRVRDAQTGSLLAGAQVEARSSSGAEVGSATTDVGGRFSISGLAGVVYATARSSTNLHQVQLYDGLPCPAGCDPTTGTPVPVQVGQVTTGVDFALERYGAVAGTVTRQSDGTPIPNLSVQLFDQNGQVAGAATDDSGSYQIAGVPAGTYFLKTSSGEYIDELYDGLGCSPTCQPADGTPVAVANGSTTEGIDFSLVRWGALTGHATESGSNVPLPVFGLTLYDGDGEPFILTHGFGGTFEITGLAAGTYFLSAASTDHVAEVYDDVACPQALCDGGSGTPLLVGLDATVEGIDFALEPLGVIAGQVLDAATNQPVAGARVQVWDASGQLTGLDYSAENGRYEVRDLYAGNHFVSVDQPLYLGGLFDALPCSPSCDPTTGTPVPVVLGTTTDSIDFSLNPLGRFSGVVRAAQGAASIPNAEIEVYDTAGILRLTTSADANGAYDALGLTAGSYFAVAHAFGFSFQLYDGLSCPPGACEPTTGSPLVVSDGTTLSNVDFSLPAAGTLSGRITSLGVPIPDRLVYIHRSDGSLWSSVISDLDGQFEATVPAGDWFVLVPGNSDQFSQLYDGISCTWPCDVLTGDTVEILAGMTTGNVNFELEPARGFVGRVSDRAGNPLPDVAIDLWTNGGSYSATGVTGPDGFYHLLPLNAGSYRLSTDNGIGGLDEVWDDVPCPFGPAYLGLCDPTSGQALVLPTGDALVNDIDFVLSFVPLFADGFESGDSDAWSGTSP